MSVFTNVKQPQLEAFLERYDIGRLRAFGPIAAGITNTNYTLDTEAGAFVLTLYEHHSDDELDYMLGLQRHLADRSVACAAPVGDRRGDYFSPLNQRPAAIIMRLPGEVQPRPGIAHCAAVGAELARFHAAGMDFAGRRINPRGADWVFAVSDMLDADLDDTDRLLIASTLREYQGLDFESLPTITPAMTAWCSTSPSCCTTGAAGPAASSTKPAAAHCSAPIGASEDSAGPK